jgi:hypothetical protein
LHKLRIFKGTGSREQTFNISEIFYNFHLEDNFLVVLLQEAGLEHPVKVGRTGTQNRPKTGTQNRPKTGTQNRPTGNNCQVNNAKSINQTIRSNN